MAESQIYSRRTVMLARALFVVTGSVLIAVGAYVEAIAVPGIRFLGYGLEVLGACVLGFGAFARGNACAQLMCRLLSHLAR